MKNLVLVVFSLLIFLVLAYIFIIPCDRQSGWGIGQQRRCTCKGVKIVTEDSLPIDGDFISYCIGIVNSSECYVYSAGTNVNLPCEN